MKKFKPLFKPDVPHYDRLVIEPVDYVAANGLGYFEANVVKYVSRYKHKGAPLADLIKARNNVNWLIELEERRREEAHAAAVEAVQGVIAGAIKGLATTPPLGVDLSAISPDPWGIDSPDVVVRGGVDNCEECKGTLEGPTVEGTHLNGRHDEAFGDCIKCSDHEPPEDPVSPFPSPGIGGGGCTYVDDAVDRNKR